MKFVPWAQSDLNTFKLGHIFSISTLGPKSFHLLHHSGYQVAVTLYEAKFSGLAVCRLSTQLYLRTFLGTGLASAALNRNIISARPHYQYKYFKIEQTYERRYFVNACYLFSCHKVLSLLFLPFSIPNTKCYKTATLRKSYERKIQATMTQRHSLYTVLRHPS
jgi:hypothetical protein